ncbi:MAG: ribosomal RNA small subunit methyltransferase A [Deltaproteobacteria bacterium]|nr:ribosomal RNA small subunit methyltransferase A [Deltaproteobacteria bacterium]
MAAQQNHTAHRLLARYRIRPTKRLGQNFLVNRGVLEKIVRAVAPEAGERLLEIGPGLGTLTRLLAMAGAHVTAIEADRRMVELLEAELGGRPNVRIVYGDILEVDLDALIPTPRWRAVGNIPYNISSPILFLLRDQRQLFSEAILMLQKEVAERLTARVGTKEYGLLTIGLGAVGTCERIFDVAPGSFWPPPKVTSSIVRLRFPELPPYPMLDLAAFTRVVRAAFGKRRKTIRNALVMAAAEGQYGFTPTPRAIDVALSTAGIDPVLRPETVTIAHFAALTGALAT